MHKVLVANRGEIALRVIRACREQGIASVAVYSEADAGALFARRADEAVCIGRPPARASYLNGEAILEAARAIGADAVHPGYGFLSENAAFAAACRDAGLAFVGPSPEVIAQMGDKATARAVAASAGVPVVPGSNGREEVRAGDNGDQLADLLAAAAEVGYPVMVKAAAGGGGRGIRVAEGPAELAEVAPVAAREALGAFGDGLLYVEKLLRGARHVEVQVLGDEHGNVVHLFERECSLQRRRQKLIEEAPALGLDAPTRVALLEAAVRLARAVGYASAGTVEFLVDADQRFFFLEMNTRLQVEHGVTEMITGVDIVREQLRVADGHPLGLRQGDLVARGCAIEFRINAEDPDDGFRPSPGRIGALELPGGPGVRVDAAIHPGHAMPPYYDSLLAKLIVWAPTRDQAIARGRRALEELVIEGVATTTKLHRRLLDDVGVVAGAVHTGYLEEVLA